MKNASDMLPNPDWSKFYGVVSGKSQTTGRDMIEGFIREDLPKLETHELTKVYKFIRRLIAETN